MNQTTITVTLTTLATLLAIGLLILVVALLRRRLGIGSTASSSQVGRLIDAHGAGRAMEAIALVRDLSTRSNPDEITTIWFRIAPAIEASVPTCPPAVRVALQQALTQAAAACPSKAVAKAMSDCAERCR